MRALEEYQQKVNRGQINERGRRFGRIKPTLAVEIAATTDGGLVARGFGEEEEEHDLAKRQVLTTTTRAPRRTREFQFLSLLEIRRLTFRRTAAGVATTTTTTSKFLSLQKLNSRRRSARLTFLPHSQQLRGLLDVSWLSGSMTGSAACDSQHLGLRWIELTFDFFPLQEVGLLTISVTRRTTY